MPSLRQVITMELGHIVSFILGGFISAIIFYPKKKKKPDVEFVAKSLAYWWFSGIYHAQTSKDILKVDRDLILPLATNRISVEYFETAAKRLISVIEKDIK